MTLPPGTSDLIRYLSQGYFPVETELSIDDALKLALEHNHDLNSKRLDALAACQGIKINWAALRPQLSAQGKAYWLRNNAPPHTQTVTLPDGTQQTVTTGTEDSMITSLALSLTQRIYDFGLTRHLIDTSRAQYAIKNYTVSMAEQQLVTNVIISYYRFSLALGQVRIRRDALGLANEFLRQAQIQFNVGTVPKLDVIRAEARVQQAQDDFVSALSAVGDAAASFYSWLGVEDQRYVPAVITADLIDLGAEPPDVAQATQTAVDTRSEVQLQYATLLAGQAKIDLAKNRPILQAYANALYQQPATQGGTDNYEYGLQMLWNVYTGGADRLNREQAETQLKALAEGVLDLEAKVELDATIAWNQLYASRASVGTALKNMELSGEALRAASVGYNAGVTPYIDFQDALERNVAANMGYLLALIDVKLAQLNLQRAEGYPSGFPGDSRADMDSTISVSALLSPPAGTEAKEAAAPSGAAEAPQAEK
jgi:outer membrane protein TolC